MIRILAGILACQLGVIGVAADTITTSRPGHTVTGTHAQPATAALAATSHSGKHPWHPAGMPECHGSVQRDCYLTDPRLWTGRFGHSWTVITPWQIRALRTLDGSPPPSWRGCWVRDDDHVVVCPWFGYRIEANQPGAIIPGLAGR